MQTQLHPSSLFSQLFQAKKPAANPDPLQARNILNQHKLQAGPPALTHDIFFQGAAHHLDVDPAHTILDFSDVEEASVCNRTMSYGFLSALNSVVDEMRRKGTLPILDYLAKEGWQIIPKVNPIHLPYKPTIDGKAKTITILEPPRSSTWGSQPRFVKHQIMEGLAEVFNRLIQKPSVVSILDGQDIAIIYSDVFRNALARDQGSEGSYDDQLEALYSATFNLLLDANRWDVDTIPVPGDDALKTFKRDRDICNQSGGHIALPTVEQTGTALLKTLSPSRFGVYRTSRLPSRPVPEVTKVIAKELINLIGGFPQNKTPDFWPDLSDSK